MNIQVVTATLRDKKYEIQFIEALSNSIVNEIENINNIYSFPIYLLGIK
ncbi:hypothetical protein [Arcobacter sp. CECT 9188]|nr:hypothetical protein [Arcobacter sp. CECT 9188]